MTQQREAPVMCTIEEATPLGASRRFKGNTQGGGLFIDKYI